MATTPIRKKTSAVKKRGGKVIANGISPLLYIFFGVLFGYFLSKARATDTTTVVDMFLFKDFQLYGVILITIATVFIGFTVFRVLGRSTQSGEKLDWKKAAWKPKRLTGAFLFGAGWAVSGICPGTAVAQLGEGKLSAVFALAGIFLGIWVYERFMPAQTPEDEVC